MNQDDERYRDHYGGGDMSVSTHCSRFSRRNDFDMFNMSTYQSCENCRHMSADSKCVVNAQQAATPME